MNPPFESERDPRQLAYEAQRRIITNEQRVLLRDQRVYNVVWERLMCQHELDQKYGYEERT